MEFANDLLVGLRSPARGAPQGAEMPGIDWAGLRARFAAAHAARREIARFESPRPMIPGSFSGWHSLAAIGANSLPPVNPIDSADGKIPAGMEGFDAGNPVAGGRGQ